MIRKQGLSQQLTFTMNIREIRETNLRLWSSWRALRCSITRVVRVTAPRRGAAPKEKRSSVGLGSIESIPQTSSDAPAPPFRLAWIRTCIEGRRGAGSAGAANISGRRSNRSRGFNLRPWNWVVWQCQREGNGLVLSVACFELTPSRMHDL